MSLYWQSAYVQSPPKESIHLRQTKYSKSRWARGKVGGVPHAPLGWSKLEQALFQNEAWPSLDQLNGTRLDKSVYFLLVETVWHWCPSVHPSICVCLCVCVSVWLFKSWSSSSSPIYCLCLLESGRLANCKSAHSFKFTNTPKINIWLIGIP